MAYFKSNYFASNFFRSRFFQADTPVGNLPKGIKRLVFFH